MYKTPPRRYFGSTWSSDFTGLNSSLFEISNAYNCNIVCICCFNAYWLFSASNYVLLRQSAYGLNKIMYSFVLEQKDLEMF